MDRAHYSLQERETELWEKRYAPYSGHAAAGIAIGLPLSFR